MDAFYASVEARDHGEWRGKPLVVAYAGTRSVVAAASYEARRFGIYSAMPLAQAQRRCPELVVAPPRMSLYVEISKQLHAIYLEYCQKMEPLALDECFLEMDPHANVGQQMLDLRRRIRTELNLPASAGIGPNKFVAKVASTLAKPNGQMLVRPAEVCAFLWPLSVENLWGVGPVTAGRLHAQGWYRIEQIANEEPERLQMVLGKLGRDIHRLAWGQDDRPVETGWNAKTLSAEHTFERDQDDLGTLSEVLRHQAEELEKRLQRKGLLAQQVVVKLRWPDFHSETRSLRLPAARDSARDFFEPALAHLQVRLQEVGQPVRLLGLGVGDLISQSEPRQLELF